MATTISFYPSPVVVSPVSATQSTSTSSSSFSVISGIATTPPPGRYMFKFSASIGLSSDASGQIAIFLDGEARTETIRRINIQASGVLGASANGSVVVETDDYIYVDGSQTVDVRFRSISGTVTAYERTLMRVQVTNL